MCTGVPMDNTSVYKEISYFDKQIKFRIVFNYTSPILIVTRPLQLDLVITISKFNLLIIFDIFDEYM